MCAVSVDTRQVCPPGRSRSKSTHSDKFEFIDKVFFTSALPFSDQIYQTESDVESGSLFSNNSSDANPLNYP